MAGEAFAQGARFVTRQRAPTGEKCGLGSLAASRALPATSSGTLKGCVLVGRDTSVETLTKAEWGYIFKINTCLY